LKEGLQVTALRDVKASGNWMYAAKLDGEGAAMYDAAVALKDAMVKLEVAIDGGKDSLSMAAQAGGETVKAPGNLVISTYVTCPDITKTVTPDLKLGDKGVLLHIDIGKGKRRLGGSCLAQVYDQIGDTPPDVDDVPYLGQVFNAVQGLIDKRAVASGHDISDGGIIVALLEMAFAGNCGIHVDLPVLDIHGTVNAKFAALFAEELGLLLEVEHSKQEEVIAELQAAGVQCNVIGHVQNEASISVAVNGEVVVAKPTSYLRDIWEETSFSLERLQRLEACVQAEQEGLKFRQTPSWKLSFTPAKTRNDLLVSSVKPKVAIIREEGSNGDREMSAMALAAGFEPWDVTMSDLLNSRASLKEFRGVVFVGGFSYGDVLDSAKGWAGTIRFNESLLQQVRFPEL
jgi:phosphoribosylformylglycinamidine synthase